MVTAEASYAAVAEAAESALPDSVEPAAYGVLVGEVDGRPALARHDVAALDVRRLRRRVGMVFQRPTPFPGTVHENLRVAEPSLDEDGAIALLASVGLPAEFFERDALTLSGGEAQRMCTARTLATRPEVVLMDEPTSALDEDNARGVEDLARSLVGAGVSIVWVTHDRAQIERIADVVHPKPAMRLNDGRVLPAHPFDPSAPALSDDVPIMVGGTKDETAIFFAPDDKVWNRTITEEEALTADLRRLGDAARTLVG